MTDDDLATASAVNLFDEVAAEASTETDAALEAEDLTPDQTEDVTPDQAAVRRAGMMRRLGRFDENEFAEREYARLQKRVVGLLRKRMREAGVHYDELDLQGFYNHAFHQLVAALKAGKKIDTIDGFVITAATRRAIEEARVRRPRLQADEPDIGETGRDSDFAAELDTKRALQEWRQTVHQNLTEREAKAVVMCDIQGFSRPEAAQLLGETPKRMEKIMDGAKKKLGAFYPDIEAGSLCERPEMRSLMRAYALEFHTEGSPRAAHAREHLEQCSHCRRFVRGLRGLAAAVPPVGLPISTEAGSHLDQLNGMLDVVWNNAQDLLSLAGEHTSEIAAGGAATITGATVATGSAGTTTGAATAAGGAAAVGVGATATGSSVLGGIAATMTAKVAAVCATAAVCTGGIVTVTKDKTDDKPKPKPRTERTVARPSSAPVPVNVTRITQPAQQTKQTGSTSTKASSKPKTSTSSTSSSSTPVSSGPAATRQQEAEFGFESQPAAAAAPAPASSPAPAPKPAPKPAPATSGDEFGFEGG